MSLDRHRVAPVSPDPRHTTVWVSLLMLTTTLILGCGQQVGTPRSDSIAETVPAIHLAVSPDGDSSSVEVQGLDPLILSALDTAMLDRLQWEQVLRIAVEQETPIADSDIPPVLGSYAVLDGLIRFTPMFPFDPGRNYVVTFDPFDYVEETGSPIVSIVDLPPDTAAPSVRVVRIYPTTNVLPENQLKVYIYFSAPMRASNGLPYVKLVDEVGSEVESAFLPLGEVLGTGLWDPSRQRYTVFFDPGRIKQGLVLSDELGRSVTEGARYTLLIDNAWPDANGNPLTEGFQKEFRVGPPDTEPIDLTRWDLSRLPSNSTHEPLVMSFPEPLDHGLLGRALSVITRAGDRLEGEIQISEGETRWAFIPHETWARGEYSILVSSFLEDLAGNRIGAPFEISALEPVDTRPEGDFSAIPFSIR